METTVKKFIHMQRHLFRILRWCWQASVSSIAVSIKQTKSAEFCELTSKVELTFQISNEYLFNDELNMELVEC